MMENYKHTTVLLDEAVNGLNIRPDGIYIDGTFGRGGHSRLILSRLGAEGRLLAIFFSVLMRQEGSPFCTIS